MCLPFCLWHLNLTAWNKKSVKLSISFWHGTGKTLRASGSRPSRVSTLSRRRRWPQACLIRLSSNLADSLQPISALYPDRTLQEVRIDLDVYRRWETVTCVGCLLLAPPPSRDGHQPPTPDTRTGTWVRSLLERKPTRVVTVAIANKTARTAWALLSKGESYKAVPAI